MKVTNEDSSDQSDNEDDMIISVNKNKVTFHADVDRKSCKKLMDCINKAKEYVAINNILDEFNNDMKVYLSIFSDGGEVYSAFSVIDSIIQSKVDIITINEGCVSSAGVLISLAGKERYIRKNSYMLIHEIRSACWGKYSECVDDMDNNELLMNHIKSFILNRCNNKKLEKKINKFLKHDKIWNAEKCLKYGLVTKVI